MSDLRERPTVNSSPGLSARASSLGTPETRARGAGRETEIEHVRGGAGCAAGQGMRRERRRVGEGEGGRERGGRAGQELASQPASEPSRLSAALLCCAPHGLAGSRPRSRARAASPLRAAPLRAPPSRARTEPVEDDELAQEVTARLHALAEGHRLLHLLARQLVRERLAHEGLEARRGARAARALQRLERAHVHEGPADVRREPLEGEGAVGAAARPALRHVPDVRLLARAAERERETGDGMGWDGVGDGGRAKGECARARQRRGVADRAPGVATDAQHGG